MNTKEEEIEEEEQSDSENDDAGAAISTSEDESLNTEEEDIESSSVEQNDQEAAGTSEDTPKDQDIESEDEETSDSNDDTDSSIETNVKRFNKSFRVKSLAKAKNLLKGPVLYVSYVSDDAHMTVILRSVSWFDQEYFDRVLTFLQAEHPSIDAKILGDADFGDPQQPGSVVKLVESPFHDTVMKAIENINGWKFVPHITFPSSDDIPEEIKDMKLLIQFSYPNWKFDFNGSLRATHSRMKGRLKY